MENVELNKAIADLVNRLPALPATADRILTLAASEDGNDEEIIDMIREDSSLCVELLHLANNSCVVRNGSIDNIDDAIDLIGIKELVQVTAVNWANTSIKNSYSELTHLEKYFQHEQEISRTCQILADLSGQKTHQCKMSFAGGLIHDIGRLVIMIAEKKPFAPMLGITPQDMAQIINDETQTIGMNHCQIGERICKNWHFSPILCEGILRHHTPLVGDDFSYPGAYIFVAHFVSMSDLTGQMLATALPPGILERLNLSPEKFDLAKDLYKAIS